MTHKFIQTLDNKPFREVKKFGKKRGITLQQMLRAVVIPEWLGNRLVQEILRRNKASERRLRKERAKARRKGKVSLNSH